MSDPSASLPHIIRLRGPWEIRPLLRFVQGEIGGLETATDLSPPSRRLQIPANWSAPLGPDFRGQVRHQRFFHCPTGLGAGERVWLVCDGATDRAVVTLNDLRLGEFAGPSAAARFDVTESLKLRNELLIDVTFPADETPRDEIQDRCGGLTGEVRLEIFAAPSRR